MHRHIRLLLLLSLLSAFINGYSINNYNKDSLPILNSAVQIPKEIELYNKLCRYAELSTNADTILKYSDEAIGIAERALQNPAKALILKGNGLHLSGKLTQAVECFTKAAHLYFEDENFIGLATAYTYLSETYISQQHHSNATLYLKKAIDIFTRENDSARLASSLHNLGFEYYKVRQYDSALILFAYSSILYQNLQDEQENAYCIGNSGLVYSKLNDLTKAEQNLLKAIDVLQKYSDMRAVADFTIEYAYVLQRKGKIEKAILNTHEAFAIATKNNITELKRDAAFRLSQIYEQIQQYDSAFHYQLIYYKFSDSIRNVESIQKTADLRTEFEVAQKQVEVDILEKNKTIQLIIIGSLGVIIFIAGGLIILIYLSLKRNRKLTNALEDRQKQLEEQSSKLRELNSIKDRFFSIISHDLRSPLFSLSGISFMIRESLENDNRALLNQATDYIDQTVISLTGLLENLLNWALSQQGKFPFKPEKIELEPIIAEVVKTFASLTLSKNQHMQLSYEQGLSIEADKNSVMAILRNLVSNAIKFTNTGGQIKINTRKIDNSYAEIIVNDNGIGISEEKMVDLFKFKDDKSSRGTENEKGIGLGLNLVYEFVALNKGTIQGHSKEGEGTTFILHFPLKS
jgi:two-component system NtrC family sensor kinase